MTFTAAAQTATDDFRNASLSSDEKVSAIRNLAGDLPDDKKKQLANGLLFEVKPSQKTADALYLIIIVALLVILLAAAGIIFKIFPTGAEIDKVLGVFTTVLSFILGLFAPSPVTKS